MSSLCGYRRVPAASASSVTSSSSVLWRRLFFTNTRSARVSLATISCVSRLTITYSDSAGRKPPSASVNASTTLSGSIVILSPGMYTVDRRVRAIASTSSPRWMPSAGAAICTPIRTRPSARCSTENASSISVVVMSSIENACDVGFRQIFRQAADRDGRKAGAVREKLRQESRLMQRARRRNRRRIRASDAPAKCRARPRRLRAPCIRSCSCRAWSAGRALLPAKASGRRPAFSSSS